MFFVNTKYGFFSDGIAQLLFTPDVRNAHVFNTSKEADQFARTWAHSRDDRYPEKYWCVMSVTINDPF